MLSKSYRAKIKSFHIVIVASNSMQSDDKSVVSSFNEDDDMLKNDDFSQKIISFVIWIWMEISEQNKNTLVVNMN